MRNGLRCRHCGSRLRVGRAGIHERRECVLPWYQRERQQHPRKAGRPAEPDLPPELIERIMARRAAEQRYERSRRDA